MMRGGSSAVFRALGLIVLGGLFLPVSAEEPPEPRRFVTHHQLQTDSGRLDFTATVGETVLLDDTGGPEASFFSIAYTLDGVDDPGARPVTFLFNGGPGSSAVWLHLGAFGPWRVDLPDAVEAGPAPYELKSNPLSLLRVSDLVFIDPVGTGYSRPLGEVEASRYWNVRTDASSVARFIRRYLGDNDRWNSPKFIGGESYGTIRAVLVAGELRGLLDTIDINGLLLISPALDATTWLAQPGNELPYATMLPSYAAVAWHHEKARAGGKSFDAFLDEVRQFAATDYISALFRGRSLPSGERKRVVERLSAYTGLDAEFIDRIDLKLSAQLFSKELLRDEGLVIGLHDGRYTSKDISPLSATPQTNPSLDSVVGPVTAGINVLLSGELEVEMADDYHTFNFDMWQAFSFGSGPTRIFSGYLYVLDDLDALAAANPSLRIFVANGYYDMATTFFGAEYMLDHSDIDPERITLRNYEGGHMMYFHPETYPALSEDAARFIQKN